MSNPPDDESFPDFRNRPVTFYIVNTPMEYALTVNSPVFERQAGKWFVVGPIIGTPGEWAEGLKACVAWDQVSQYLVYDSYEDYHARLENEDGGFMGGFFGRN